MSLVNTSENAVLDWLFGSGDPSEYELAVTSIAPTDTLVSGPLPGEPSGNGYARVTITNNATSFPDAGAPLADGTKPNGVAFQFPVATGSWGAALGWWVLYDKDSSNPVMYGPIDPPKTIESADILRIPAGQMTLTCD